METLQVSKQTMLHEKGTPSQGNTAQEQNNANITPDPVVFFSWFSYRTWSALCKGHCWNLSSKRISIKEKHILSKYYLKLFSTGRITAQSLQILNSFTSLAK